MFKIFCGNTAPAAREENHVLLDVHGKHKNVNLCILDIYKTMASRVPDALLDLLEIAAYVYCADQRITRGGRVLSDTGSKWRRTLEFTIPVRNVDTWTSPAMRDLLEKTLWFLTEDIYRFTFVKYNNPLNLQQEYLSFDGNNIGSGGGFQPDDVALFSGGIDSLAGAVEGLIGHGKKMVLVGHHSCSKVFSTQKQLISALKERGLDKNLFYIPVEVTNQNIEAVEYTQRSRSFLYACLAMTVTYLFGRSSFSFFENGVVSLNIPTSNDVIGARATRTTHPRVLQGFQKIFSLLLDKEIIVQNPYTWKTKAEVVRVIIAHGCQSLLGMTRSCTRPTEWTKQLTHCGVCSQCLDRRFAVLAAQGEKHDPEEKYRIELLLGDRSQEQDILMAANYVRFARNISHSTFEAFQCDYTEIIQSIGRFPDLSRDEAIQRSYDLLQRHARDVIQVIERGFQDNARKVVNGTLAPGSILALVGQRRSKVEIGKIVDITSEMKNFMDRLTTPICEFAVDLQNKHIIFPGGFSLAGKEFTLIQTLLPNFRKGRNTPTGDIAYIDTETLVNILHMTEQSFRTFIKRLREKVTERLGIDLGIAMELHDFIENKSGAGYRLNKHLKEVATPADLTHNILDVAML